jgi:integration host factor subunit alpha
MHGAGKTVTRVQLYDAVYRKVGLSRSESSGLVELVLREISDSVARGETVKLSSFGTFTVRQKGERIGRNPKTGAEVPISPRRVAVFKASAIMKQQINDGRPAVKQSSSEKPRPADETGTALA